jgi:hypothetical protein
MTSPVIRDAPPTAPETDRAMPFAVAGCCSTAAAIEPRISSLAPVILRASPGRGDGAPGAGLDRAELDGGVSSVDTAVSRALPHLVGDDGEAVGGPLGACGPDRGVRRQQVRLRLTSNLGPRAGSF